MKKRIQQRNKKDFSRFLNRKTEERNIFTRFIWAAVHPFLSIFSHFIWASFSERLQYLIFKAKKKTELQ
jgi:hypothetical protein